MHRFLQGFINFRVNMNLHFGKFFGVRILVILVCHYINFFRKRLLSCHLNLNFLVLKSCQMAVSRKRDSLQSLLLSYVLDAYAQYVTTCRKKQRNTACEKRDSQLASMQLVITGCLRRF